MFNRILVPLDGSSFGEHALPWALSIARRAEAPIELVHVYQPVGLPETPLTKEAREQGKQKARAYLDGLVERLKPVGSFGIKVSLLDGPVTERLMEQVNATGADLIVLTTHGRGPLSRYWLGSVADELIRRATVPLLLIRPQEEATELTNELAVRRILIPLDGSPFAEQILEPAMALGTLMQAEYRLVRVVTPAVATGPDPWFSPPLHVPDLDLQSHARAYLKRIWERLQEGQPRTVRAHVESAFQPAVAILKDGQRAEADLIALATHGRTGISRLVLGSVADKVVRGAMVPVLVQRPSTTP